MLHPGYKTVGDTGQGIRIVKHDAVRPDQQVARMECNEIRGEDDNSSRISLCYIRAIKLLATPDREYALSSMMQSAPIRVQNDASRGG